MQIAFHVRINVQTQGSNHIWLFEKYSNFEFSINITIYKELFHYFL